MNYVYGFLFEEVYDAVGNLQIKKHALVIVGVKVASHTAKRIKLVTRHRVFGSVEYVSKSDEGRLFFASPEAAHAAALDRAQAKVQQAQQALEDAQMVRIACHAHNRRVDVLVKEPEKRFSL